jgi:hypothetical protein
MTLALYTAVRTHEGSAVTSMRLNTRGTPLVAGGIAFGSGVLLGWVVRASRAEQRLGQQA